MATRISLADGASLLVRESYRDVYERLLATGWQHPCEFRLRSDGEEPRVTVNPSYVVSFCEADGGDEP